MLKYYYKIEVNTQGVGQPSRGSALSTYMGTPKGPMVLHEPWPTKQETLTHT